MKKIALLTLTIGWLVASIAPALSVPVGNNVEYIPATRNLGVGVIDPEAKLEINGQVMITGGNPGADKVLTTDATGLASWEVLTVLASNVTGTVANATNAVNATNITGGTITNSTFTNGIINGATLVNVTLPPVTNALVSKLIAPDGSPDPALSVDNLGRVTAVDSLTIDSSGVVKGVIDMTAPYYGYSVDATGVGGNWARSFNFFDNGKQLGGFGAYGLGPSDEIGYIYLNANGASHTGSLALAIPKSNNVGMGTTNPSERLEVVGNVKATKFIGDGSMLTGISAADVDNATTANVADFATTAGTATMAVSATTADSATNLTGGVISNSVITNANLAGQIIGGVVNGSNMVNVSYDDPFDPWILIHSEDFETNPVGWSNNTRTSCVGRNILGGFGVAGAGASLQKVFNLAGISHSHVLVRFNYYTIDSWDDEAAIAKIDGFTVWSNSRIHFSDQGRFPFANCGSGGASDYYDAVLQGEAYIEHTSDSLNLNFTSTLNEAANNESFGIDNVEIWVKKSGPIFTVPAPPAPPAPTGPSDNAGCSPDGFYHVDGPTETSAGGQNKGFGSGASTANFAKCDKVTWRDGGHSLTRTWTFVSPPRSGNVIFKVEKRRNPGDSNGPGIWYWFQSNISVNVPQSYHVGDRNADITYNCNYDQPTNRFSCTVTKVVL